MTVFTLRAPGWRLNPFAAAMLCSGALNAPAFAQSTPPAADAQTLAPVTVTGETPAPETLSSPKFTAPLLDTPQTLTVIPETLYREQGAQTLNQVLRNTPGISFNAGENGFGTETFNFQMRGFDTSGSIFIDGARDSGNYSRDVFNLEQVEVAKGPAADNGRGGGGGYINLVSKAPKLQDSFSGTASYGFDEYDSDERLRATADLNKVIGQNSAVRLNLLVQDGGVIGRDVAEKKSIGFAPSLALGLNTSTRLIASYQYYEQNDLPDWGVPAALIDGMMRHDPSLDEDLRDKFYGLRSDFDDVTAHAVLARIAHDFASGLRLSNQTRWSSTDREARFTAATAYDAQTADVATQTWFFVRDNTSLSNLTNLSFTFRTGALKHRLAAGLEFSREESDGDRIPTVNQPATPVANPDPGRGTQAPLTATQFAGTRIDTAALYVYDTVEFSEAWQLTGGLRAEQYKVKLDSKDAAGAPLRFDDYDVDKNTLGGKLGVVYKPSRTASIYASVGLATLPPGAYLSNPDISRTGDNAFPGFDGQNSPDAKVQRALNYELGTKWELFDERLITTAAIFQTERRRVAISGRAEGETVTSLKGYGKQIVQGIELSATGRVTPAWSVFAGLSLIDSERRHSTELDEARCRAQPTDYQAGATAADCAALVRGPLGTNGDKLAFTPELTANLWTSYRFTGGFTVGGGLQHVDDSIAGRPDDADRIIPNGNFGELPGYTVFNAMASYEVNNRLNLRLNVDNLTDEVYAVSTNWAAQRVFLGSSRAFLLSADFRF